MMDLPGVLPLLLIALYLADSMHFLGPGEALVVVRARRLRAVSLGGRMEFGGRRPYLPNPLTPFWPELRLHWEPSAAAGQNPQLVASEMQRLLHALRHIARLCAVSAVLVAVIAPGALLLGRSDLFVAAVGAGFTVTTANCVLVARARGELGLTGWQACSMSVVALLCLPCGVNLARAAALQRRWRVAASDLPLLAPPHTRSSIRRDLRSVLETARSGSEEDSVQYRLIGEQLQLLRGTDDEPR